MKTLATNFTTTIRAAYLLCCFTILSARLATAEIVHADVDPDIAIEWRIEHTEFGNMCDGDSAQLDLDGTGTAEVSFFSICGLGGGGLMQWSHSASTSGDFVVQNGNPAKLEMGEQIGPASPFDRTDGYLLLEGIDPIPSLGNWRFDAQNKFLGLQFDIDGDSHFGWIRLSVTYDTVIVHDYAYEAQPDMAITAGVVPEPSSPLLGVLGCLGLLLRRSAS